MATYFPGLRDDARLRGRFHAPPLVWWTREGDGGGEGRREVRNFLGPLYHQYHEAAASRDGKAPAKRATHVMWPLVASSVEHFPDGETKRTFRALPFTWITRRSEPSGAGYDYYQIRANVLGAVFSLSADNYGEGYVSAHILMPLGKYFRGEKRVRGELRKFRSFRLVPIVHYERSWRPGKVARARGRLPGFQPGLRSRGRFGEVGSGADGAGRGQPGTGPSPEGIRLDERATFRFLHFLLGLEREAAKNVTRLYLVGTVPVDRKTGHSSILALWGSERGPSTDREDQLLWRMLLFKRSGAPEMIASTLPASPAGDVERPSDRWRLVQWMFHGSPKVRSRVGPLFSYESDWESDTKRVSVLFGLCSYRREGLEKSGRLLWFIPWRGRGSTAAGPSGE
jgi:hypothetical protein